MSLQLILGVLQLLDFLKITIHPTIHHTTITTTYQLGLSLVAPLLVLDLAWFTYYLQQKRHNVLLVSTPLILVLIQWEFITSLTSLLMGLVGLHYMTDKAKFTEAALWVLALFNMLAVVHYTLMVPLGWTEPLKKIADAQLNTHYALSYLSPLLVLPVLFFWLVKPLLETNIGISEQKIPEEKTSITWALLLVFSITLSAYASLYPYLPGVNPGNLDFGVDVKSYVKMFEAFEGRSVLDRLRETRLFFLLFLQLFKTVTGLDSLSAIRFLPIVLNPMFVASSYYFTYECFRNSRIAAWAAFFASTGYVIPVGMYSYFLTNNLALCLILLSLGLLLRAVREADDRYLALACILGVLLVFTHPWTMDQYLAGLPLLAAYLWLRESQRDAVALGKYLLVVAFFEVVKTFMLQSVGGAAATSTAVSGLTGLSGFWFSSIFSFRYLYGGFMSNALPFVYAIMGIFRLDRTTHPGRYLYVFMVLTSLVFLLSGETTKSRLLYNVPVYLFASLGLSHLQRRQGTPLLVFTAANSLFYLFLTISNVTWAA